MFSPEFTALGNEAEFTREMLASGATQIRNANYASKGVYFQAFTSLSTGLERIGKLCLMLDHNIDHGTFPDQKYMKEEICHQISLIYEKSAATVVKRSLTLRHLNALTDPIHLEMLNVFSDFAQGDRYCNINILVGRKRQNDPMSAWYSRVDLPLFERCVSKSKKEKIRANAQTVKMMWTEPQG